MTGKIDDVTIVGGGDSGLLCGLALQRLNPGLDVTIVDDFERDVPEVGKSTFLTIFSILHDTLDVDEQRFVSEVKPVWKASVYFRDWCDRPPFHYPFDVATKFPAPDTTDAVEYLYRYYDELHASPDHRTRCEAIVEQGKSPWYFDYRRGEHRKYDSVAYHFDSARFNGFLRDLCRERGIGLVDDEIVAVDATGDRIDRVRSETGAYEADLYVDATGFARVLKGELDDEFVDFGFPLDSAYNARYDRPLSEVVPATVVESGEHGWFWQIDTYDDRDLGYVYASEYADDDEALAAFLDHCDGDVSAADVERYEFDSGFYEQAWQGNCVAIGNAEGFVEPLQSTGLTLNAQAGVTLSNLLSARGRVDDGGIRDAYNAWVRRSWESTYDFISVHYKYSNGDTPFWEAMSSLDVSERVDHLFEEFDRVGFDTTLDPTTTDTAVEDLIVFRPRNFYTLARSMGATSAFYETNEFDVNDAVAREEDERYESIREDVADHLTTEELYRGVLEL